MLLEKSVTITNSQIPKLPFLELAYGQHKDAARVAEHCTYDVG